jgi:hypothetical protein
MVGRIARWASFVSNGPLLRCRVNGQPPGHVFKAAAGKQLHLKKAALTAQDPISPSRSSKTGRSARHPPDGWKNLAKVRLSRTGRRPVLWLITTLLLQSEL